MARLVTRTPTRLLTANAGANSQSTFSQLAVIDAATARANDAAMSWTRVNSNAPRARAGRWEISDATVQVIAAPIAAKIPSGSTMADHATFSVAAYHGRNFFATKIVATGMKMAKQPLPGQPVRGSRSGSPIMALFDLLGRRWAMGVLWTLCTGGPCTFRELQERCNSISPTVLNTRLRELRDALLVEHSDAGYQATELGRSLYELLMPLGAWSRGWGEQLLQSE